MMFAYQRAVHIGVGVYACRWKIVQPESATMTSPDPTTTRRGKNRSHIQIGGDTWKHRHEFARDELGVSDETVQRMNRKTLHTAGIAYVLIEERQRQAAARPPTQGTAAAAMPSAPGEVINVI
jgi:hypothetical protein